MILILITSLLNPINKPLSYTKVRSIYSIEDRFQQTLKTINSVKSKIPNYYIILLEASNNIEKYDVIFKELVNEYYNFKDDEKITEKVESKYKGLGEVYMLLGYLNNNNLNKFDSIIKISGRYYLDNTFNFNIFDSNNNIFRSFYSNVVSTRLYKITNSYFFKFIENLKNSIEYLEKGISVEEVFYKLITYLHVNHLGLSGNVAVSGDKIEE